MQDLTVILEKVYKKAVECSCVVGFDGFVDHITKPIYKRHPDSTEHFSSLTSYGEYLVQKGACSTAVELSECCVKYGGNNPIMSLALGKSGVDVTTIGAYGAEKIDKVFSQLKEHCKVISFANPGCSIVLEFMVNKFISYINMSQKEFTYEHLTRVLPQKQLCSLAEKSDMWILVNVSEQPAVLEIWKGLLKEVFSKSEKKFQFFFDLSDCSRLAYEKILEIFCVIGDFKKYGKVIVSCNENEFIKLIKVYRCAGEPKDFSELCQEEIKECLGKLKESLGVDILILRTLDYFYAFENNMHTVVENSIEENPKILTGAGDNQNSGICLGLLSGLSLEEALQLGVFYGNHYIKTGESFCLKEYVAGMAPLRYPGVN